MYLYRQNNSGGGWSLPAINVVVEADSPEEADSIAEQHGIYFDGVANGIDCECCGERWRRAVKGYNAERLDEPHRIGNSMWLKDGGFLEDNEIANVLLVPKTKKEVSSC